MSSDVGSPPPPLLLSSSPLGTAVGGLRLLRRDSTMPQTPSSPVPTSPNPTTTGHAITGVSPPVAISIPPILRDIYNQQTFASSSPTTSGFMSTSPPQQPAAHSSEHRRPSIFANSSLSMSRGGRKTSTNANSNLVVIAETKEHASDAKLKDLEDRLQTQQALLDQLLRGQARQRRLEEEVPEARRGRSPPTEEKDSRANAVTNDDDDVIKEPVKDAVEAPVSKPSHNRSQSVPLHLPTTALPQETLIPLLILEPAETTLDERSENEKSESEKGENEKSESGDTKSNSASPLAQNRHIAPPRIDRRRSRSKSRGPFSFFHESPSSPSLSPLAHGGTSNADASDIEAANNIKENSLTLPSRLSKLFLPDSVDVDIAARHLGLSGAQLPRLLQEEGISRWAAITAASVRSSAGSVRSSIEVAPPLAHEVPPALDEVNKTAPGVVTPEWIDVFTQRDSSETVIGGGGGNCSSGGSPTNSISGRRRISSRKKTRRSAVMIRSSLKGSRSFDDDGDDAYNSDSKSVKSAKSVARLSQKDDRSTHTIIEGLDLTDLAMRQDFLIKLIRSLALFGAPSHRLEYHMSQVSEALDVEAEFLVFPGMILISFGGISSRSSSHIVKTPQGINLGKLGQINAICLMFTEGIINVQDAIQLIEAVFNANDYPWWLNLATYPTMSFALCVMGFNGTWLDSAVAGLLGMLVGIMSLASEKFPPFAHLLEFVASLLSAFLAKTVQWFLSTQGSCLNYFPIVLSAIAVLLPGLSLTIAIIELSTRNLVSGTVRMFGALFTAMLLGFGMTIGGVMCAWSPVSLDSPTTACGESPSHFWSILIFWPLAFSVNIAFKANIHQWPIMTLAAGAGWLVSAMLQYNGILTAYASAQTALASFVIGFISNLYSRLSHDVAVAPILAGILLQVPGSLGVRGTLTLFAGDQSIVDGVKFTFSMLTIGMSLALGLFLATFVVYPFGPSKRSLTF